MNFTPPSAKQAIQNAYQALRKGDRQLARRWAEQAAALAPQSEEPWLLLAAASRPQTCLQYLQRALQVNPESRRAQADIEQTRQYLQQAASQREGEAKRRTAATRRMALWALFLALVFLGATVWGGVSSAQAVFATPAATAQNRSWQEVSVAKPTYTPSPTPTATPLPPPTPISTVHPVPAQQAETEAEPTVQIEGATYIVQRGDTLGQIAMRFGLSVDEVASANHLSDPSSIYAGQELVLPGVDFVPIQAPMPVGPKRIVVDISEQHLYAYEGDLLVYSFIASTGMNNATAIGTFSVLNKIPNAYGSTWNIWMPYWLGIYWSGGLQNGIHALPILPGGTRLWAGYLGTPISYGCVVLGEYEARLLYEWADIGTPVEIQW